MNKLDIVLCVSGAVILRFFIHETFPYLFSCFLLGSILGTVRGMSR